MDNKGRKRRNESQLEVGLCDSDKFTAVTRYSKLSSKAELESFMGSETEFEAVREVGFFSQKRRRLCLDHTRDCELSSDAELESVPSSKTEFEPVTKVGFFSRKRRRLCLEPAKKIVERLIKKTRDEDDDWVNSASVPKRRKYQDESSFRNEWAVKELISRDGQTKLKANVFLASFDQRSRKAAGESACTALVAVIAHWLQSNQNAMPTRSQFDSLIVQGSSEWRALCQNEALLSQFPDKHFDLEIVLQAALRPVSVLSEKSFIGFFGPEKFESLKGAMSFDDIWNEISSNVEQHNEPRVYIVSWNDHFFVLKVEANAYYIIDTLGERLFEGCKQAFILRFDNLALMEKEKTTSEEISGDRTTYPEEERERERERERKEIICRGKECCREFIKRFLAAIPLKELEAEEKKGTVSYFSLHRKLQIEFSFSSSSSSSSSSATSS